MLWSQRLSLIFVAAFASVSVATAADGKQALWQEYGLVNQDTSKLGKAEVTVYRMRDLTGALAAWESLRSEKAKACDLAQFCSVENGRTTIASANYVVEMDGPLPSKPQVGEFLKQLPNQRDSSLPAILTFLPREGRVANSARYILGPVSLQEFAPELDKAKLGFDQGAEAQVASYQTGKGGSPLRLAVFNYATPEMARIHLPDFKPGAGSHVKRSGVLVAAVLGSAPDAAADTLLSRVSYEAKITWNETPPPSPIKPLYQLLLNILYMSGLLCVLALTAGLFYAGMRVYRRRYGTLEEQESMTVLHLTE